MVRFEVRATQVPEMLGTLSGTRTSRRDASPVVTGACAAGRGAWADAAEAVMAISNAAAAAPCQSVFLTCVPTR